NNSLPSGSDVACKTGEEANATIALGVKLSAVKVSFAISCWAPLVKVFPTCSASRTPTVPVAAWLVFTKSVAEAAALPLVALTNFKVVGLKVTLKPTAFSSPKDCRMTGTMTFNPWTPVAAAMVRVLVPGGGGGGGNGVLGPVTGCGASMAAP